MRITLLGNFDISYSSETYYVSSLQTLGHEVDWMQEGEAPIEGVRDYALKSDLFIWVHGHGRKSEGMGKLLKELKNKDILTVSWHHDLMFGLGREKDLLEVDVYKYIDHFFTTDKLMAEWFNKNTKVRGHYLPSGVFDKECIMFAQTDQLPTKDVIFVGNKGYHPEWPYRPQLINWLQETYGDRFGWYSAEVQSLGVRRGLHANQLFAQSKVVVGDTLCPNFNYPYYWSDRVWETLGRGGFLIHPEIEGLDKYVQNGEHLVTYRYGDFDGLKALIDYYINTPHERDRIRQTGHELVKSRHTYKHRWETILETVFD